MAESNELALRATLCQMDSRGRCGVLSYCESNAADLASALTGLDRQLQAKGRPLPSQAILLSPQVQTTVLHLPVDPRSPLSLGNMQELVKWELEPYLSQNRTRRIGAILVGRGYLGHADLAQLLKEPEHPIRQAATGGPQRLGELAIQSGLVTQPQLDECLALQRSAHDFAGEAACGWTPLDDRPHDGKWRWLACGVARSYRQHAVDVFKDRGLRLLAMYPLVGCAGASLNAGPGSDYALFEYNSGYLSYSRFAGKRLVNSRSLFTHEAGNPIRSCADFFEDEAEQVWLAGRWPDIHSAAGELQARLGRPCKTIPIEADVPPANVTEASSVAGMEGAARHFLAPAATGCVVSVRGSDPRTPLWSNRWAQRALLAALATAMLAGATAYLQSQEHAAARQLQARRTLAAKQGEADVLRRRLGELDKSAEFMQKSLPQRQRLIPDLLTALEASCPQEVTIRRLAENAKGEIVLTGWGSSAQEIQAFKIDLQSRLAGLAVTEGMQPVRQERGWRSLPGYVFELRLVWRATGGEAKGRP